MAVADVAQARDASGANAGATGTAIDQRWWADVTPVLALVVVGESVLALLHVWLALDMAATLLVHFSIVAAAALGLLKRQQPPQDLTPPALIVLATLVAGPIGALLGLHFIRAARPPEQASPLLGDWYQRIALSAEIDPVTALCDDVASGRTMDLAARPPRSFRAVMAGGAIADQQNALGLIARRFHPDYLPALVAALRSPEPVVRVQAAAVVARIRDQLTRRVRNRLSGIEAGGAASSRALDELSKAAASGLLDDTDRRRADAILELAAARGAEPASQPAGEAPVAAASRHAHRLLGERRFKEFRVARRLHRISRLGLYRTRAPVRRVRPGSPR